MSQETGMKSTDGDAVSLKSVAIEGEVRGLMLNVTTQQQYVNKSRRNLEIVYTFPLPAHAVILGVELQIGEKTLRGVVMEKSDAEEGYEEAILEGDLPVMVERSGPGLYTANLGNLKRGESVAIKVEWAQLLSVRDGNVRIAVPTVIGKRFGDAHIQGGLAPHQTDESSFLVEYPLSFKLSITGELAHANISCPSHSAQISETKSDEGVSKVISLQSGAAMDRDVVITLDDLQNYEFYTSEQNPDGTITALASFYPKIPKKSAPLALKILVDCSGSMEGDSIAQAQEAVHQVMQQLREGDYVSYSRFGTQVVHNFGDPKTYDTDVYEHAESLTSSKDLETQEFRRALEAQNGEPELMIPVSDKKLANIGRLIRNTKASMGGTQMRAALLSTINQVVLSNQLSFAEFVPCLLLITDGDIWDYEGVVRAARASGLRIFTVGVGSAPAESLLRELTETTGGICEFVTPNESIAKVALRLVESMRTAQPAKLRVNWPAKALHTSALQSTIFAGETIHAFATLPRPVSVMPVLTIDTPLGVSCTASYPLPMDSCEDDAPAIKEFGPLARIFAHQRMQYQQPKEALQTALTYNLVSTQTNLLLVYSRETEDKAKELPSLEQIKQMHAAGHSGVGIARSEILQCREPTERVLFSMRAAYDQPTVWRDAGNSVIALSERMSESGVDRVDIPAFLRKQASPEHDQAPSPSTLIAAFNDLSLKNSAGDDAFGIMLDRIAGTVAGEIVRALRKRLASSTDALAVLLSWLSEYKSIDGCDLQRHARRLVESTLKAMDQNDAWEAFNFLDRHLQGVDAEAWNAEKLLAA